LRDDVSALTQVAAKKSAGVLGNDLALHARQVAGIRADRELAVLWHWPWARPCRKAWRGWWPARPAGAP
jgi:hypothetical protein